jgi:hypothetical protein
VAERGELRDRGQAELADGHAGFVELIVIVLAV